MKKLLLLGSIALFLLVIQLWMPKSSNDVLSTETEASHWFLLHRASNIEYLYYGEPGNKDKSTLVKTFKVKTGVPGKKPTPLHSLLGKDYWIIVEKRETKNPETTPYFLKLDIPASKEEPFGPVPYPECDGQCNWEVPGYFGLHGIGGDPERISDTNEGSSGCIRHSDEDITYLFNLLNPETEEIRYYILDI